MGNNIKEGEVLICIKDYTPFRKPCFLVGDLGQAVNCRGISVAVRSERICRTITFATKSGYDFPLIEEYFKIKE